MNEPETNPPVPDELTNQIASLRCQVTSLLLALIVVSGTLTVFLWYQSRVTEKGIDAVKPEAIRVTRIFEQNRPALDKLVRQLVVYGQSHPDFQPILKKYGIPLTLPATTNSAPTQ
jgi:hypothetical protein